MITLDDKIIKIDDNSELVRHVIIDSTIFINRRINYNIAIIYYVNTPKEILSVNIIEVGPETSKEDMINLVDNWEKENLEKVLNKLQESTW